MSPQWGGSFYLGRLGLSWKNENPGEMSPVTWGFERAKANSTKTNLPPSQITANQIVPAKQPIIEYNQRKEEAPT
jgi:hypothetical protein